MVDGHPTHELVSGGVTDQACRHIHHSFQLPLALSELCAIAATSIGLGNYAPDMQYACKTLSIMPYDDICMWLFTRDVGGYQGSTCDPSGSDGKTSRNIKDPAGFHGKNIAGLCPVGS